MKRSRFLHQEGELALASILVIGFMVLGSALAVGSQQIMKNFSGDSRSRAGETQCPGGTCPDGWSYGAGGYYGTCSARHNEACGGHQGGGGGSRATTAPTSSGGGGSTTNDCTGKDCGAGSCFTGPNANDGGWGCNCNNGTKLGPSTNPGKCAGTATVAPTTGSTVAPTTGTGGGTTNDCTGKSCGAGTCFTGPNANDGGWGCNCNNGVTLGPSTNPGTCSASTTPPPATGGSSGGGACSAGIISFGGCCGVNRRYAWTRKADCSTTDVCELESLHAGTSLCTAPTATVTPRPSLTGVSIGVPNPTATAAPSGTTCTAGYLSGGGGCCGPSKSWRVYRNTNCSTENRCDYDNPSCSYVTATPTSTPTTKLGDWSGCTTSSQCQSNRCEGFQGRVDKQCIPTNYTSEQLRSGACPAGSVTACASKNWNDVCAFGTTGIATGGGGRCAAGSASSSVCSCVSDPTATIRVTATPTKAPNWAACRVNTDCVSNRCERDPGDNTYSCLPELYTVKVSIGGACPSGAGYECSSGVCAREGDGVYRCQSTAVTSYPACDTGKVLNVTSSVAFAERCQYQSASFLQLYWQCSSGRIKNSSGTGCISESCTNDGQAMPTNGRCCSNQSYSVLNGSTPTIYCGIRPYCDQTRCPAGCSSTSTTGGTCTPYCDNSKCLNGCSFNTATGGVCISSACNSACNDSTGCRETNAQCSSMSGGRFCVCESSLRVATPPPTTTLTPGVSSCTAATSMPSNMYCCTAGPTGIVKRSGEPCTTPTPLATRAASVPAESPITAAPSGMTTCTAGYLSLGTCCASGKRSGTYRYANCTTQTRCDYNDSNCATATPATTATATTTASPTNTPIGTGTAAATATPRSTSTPTATGAPTATPTLVATYIPTVSPTPNTTLTPSPLPVACPQTYNYTECCGTGRRRSVSVTYNSTCVAQYSIGTCSDTPANDNSCGMHEQYNTNVPTNTTNISISCPAGYHYDSSPPWGWSNCQPIRCNNGYVYSVGLLSCIPIADDMTPEQRTCDLNGRSVAAGHSVCDGNYTRVCVNPANSNEDQWNRIECRNGCSNGACRP